MPKLRLVPITAALVVVWTALPAASQGYDSRDGRPPYDDRAQDEREWRDDRPAPDDADRRYDGDRRDDERAAGEGPAYERDDDRDEAALTGPRDAPDVSVFRDELDRWGRWEDDPEFGAVWVPEDVGDDWRPYTRGQWSHTTDYGWYWVSDEPWGWATYHYGRWGYDARRHWFWVPDRVWAPAWVAWRSSDDYLGWAPLPPGAAFAEPVRHRHDALEGPRFAHYWIFVRPRFFGAAGQQRFVQPPYVTEHIFPRTRAAAGLVADGGRMTNRGLAVDEVRRLTGRPVRSFRPVFSSRAERDARPLRQGLGTVTIFTPRHWGRAGERPDRVERPEGRRMPGRGPGRAFEAGPPTDARREAPRPGERRPDGVRAQRGGFDGGVGRGAPAPAAGAAGGPAPGPAPVREPSSQPAAAPGRDQPPAPPANGQPAPPASIRPAPPAGERPAFVKPAAPPVRGDVPPGATQPGTSAAPRIINRAPPGAESRGMGGGGLGGMSGGGMGGGGMAPRENHRRPPDGQGRAPDGPPGSR